ncbi:MAG: T9SS type A sorting domain-containing protein, partial [Bacteroidota bacterium]
IEIILSIYETPIVTFNPLDSVCFYASVFELSGGEPEGGSYSGTGVVDGTFDAQVAGEGTHTLSYFYEDVNMCGDTAFQTITVLPLTEVTLDPFAPVCTNTESFDLTGGTPDGGIFSGDGVTENIFYPGAAGSGDHNITYTIIDGNECSNSTYQTITVFDQPQVNIGADTTICGSETITLNATVANAASYLWTPGDFTTPSITVDSAGIGYNSQEFSVVVIDDNGCSGNDATTITFKNCTGIKEIIGLEKVSIYPNPNDGSFYLSISSSKHITVDLKVIDALGVTYLEQNQLEIVGEYSSRINIQNIKSGLYFISLTDDKGVFIKKFLVK